MPTIGHWIRYQIIKFCLVYHIVLSARLVWALPWPILHLNDARLSQMITDNNDEAGRLDLLFDWWNHNNNNAEEHRDGLDKVDEDEVQIQHGHWIITTKNYLQLQLP